MDISYGFVNTKITHKYMKHHFRFVGSKGQSPHHTTTIYSSQSEKGSMSNFERFHISIS